jgi:hypothetical protein
MEAKLASPALRPGLSLKLQTALCEIRSVDVTGFEPNSSSGRQVSDVIRYSFAGQYRGRLDDLGDVRMAFRREFTGFRPQSCSFSAPRMLPDLCHPA